MKLEAMALLGGTNERGTEIECYRTQLVHADWKGQDGNPIISELDDYNGMTLTECADDLKERGYAQVYETPNTTLNLVQQWRKGPRTWTLSFA